MGEVMWVPWMRPPLEGSLFRDVPMGEVAKGPGVGSWQGIPIWSCPYRKGGSPGRDPLWKGPHLGVSPRESRSGGCPGVGGTCSPEPGGPCGERPAAGGAERPGGGGRREPGGGEAGNRRGVPGVRGGASQQRRDGESLAGPGGGRRGRHGGLCAGPARPPLYGPDPPGRSGRPRERGGGGDGAGGERWHRDGPGRGDGGARGPSALQRNVPHASYCTRLGCPHHVPLPSMAMSPHVALLSTGMSPISLCPPPVCPPMSHWP